MSRADTSPPVSRRDVGLRSERGPILLAVMLSTALVALDATIVATAVPAIVRDLGGFREIPWLFSAYLLAQAATVPVNGKLADRLGRKPVMGYGIAMFFAGSIVCGVAGNMGVLIAGRAIQGLGAGAAQPMGMTIIGDLYSLAERAKVQGYVASVWGLSSVIGPTLGGLFTQLLSWRWVFWVNLPVCLIAAWLFSRHDERVERRHARIDVLGAVLLTVGVGLVVLGLLEGGHAWPWASWTTLAIFGVSAGLLATFAAVERRADDPVLPPWVFQRQVLVVTGGISVLVGALLLGLSSYVPLLGQEVLGASAIVSGFMLAALTLGWPIAASLSGRLYLSIGFRATGLLGACMAVLGALVLSVPDPASSVWHVPLGCLLIGFGMGWVAAPALVVAQSSVPRSERGVATATNLFARSMGSAVGVAIFGALVNAAAGSDPGAHELATGVHRVFFGILLVALAMVLLELGMPRKVESSQLAGD